MIRNTFKDLLFQRRRMEKRNIPMIEISRFTGFSVRRLTKWELSNDPTLEIDLFSITNICKYFKVDPGPLFMKNSFAKLHREKERKEKRVILVAEIARAMPQGNRKINYTWVSRWHEGLTVRYYLSDIEFFCKYFDVPPGGLFEIVPDV